MVSPGLSRSLPGIIEKLIDVPLSKYYAYPQKRLWQMMSSTIIVHILLSSLYYLCQVIDTDDDDAFQTNDTRVKKYNIPVAKSVIFPQSSVHAVAYEDDGKFPHICSATLQSAQDSKGDRTNTTRFENYNICGLDFSRISTCNPSWTSAICLMGVK